MGATGIGGLSWAVEWWGGLCGRKDFRAWISWSSGGGPKCGKPARPRPPNSRRSNGCMFWSLLRGEVKCEDSMRGEVVMQLLADETAAEDDEADVADAVKCLVWADGDMERWDDVVGGT